MLQDIPLQDLLNEEARLGNELIKVRKQLRERRKELSEEPPGCFGSDDCSSTMLVVCPWRFDCGED